MDDNLQSQEDEQLRRERIRRRRKQMREKKRRQQLFRKRMKGLLLVVGALCVITVFGTLAVSMYQAAMTDEQLLLRHRQPDRLSQEESETVEAAELSDGTKEQADAADGRQSAEDEMDPDKEQAGPLAGKPALTEDGMVIVGDTCFMPGYQANSTESTVGVAGDEDVESSYVVLVNAKTGEIEAQKDPKAVISPASMTKILTVLVAAEHVRDPEDEVTITFPMTDYAYRNECSVAGFAVDETVPVKDLFYGTILPSGGEAAVALATYVAGSHEAFVDMMNDKLDELGLSSTAHFTNCVGLYDEDHHCSVYDMAMILKAAVENDFCREVLSAHTYQTTQTEQNPEGLLLSNWFLRRIEDKDTKGEVIGAKTGFVNESRSCAASYEITESGIPYICVTADAHSSWRCIYDHVAMYSKYTK